MTLAGRVVAVTGASRGAGRAIAIALARAGARPALLASRISPELRTAEAALIGIAGVGHVLTLPTDVRNAAACERAARAIAGELGRIDALVNAARLGMRHVQADCEAQPPRFWEIAPEHWDDIASTNAIGPFYMARACMRHLLAAEGGRIVNIGVEPASRAGAGRSPTVAMHAALEAMTAIWASELADTGVTCNLLLPDGASEAALAAAIVWMVAMDSAAFNGRCVDAARWDPALDPAVAAAQASAPLVL